MTTPLADRFMTATVDSLRAIPADLVTALKRPQMYRSLERDVRAMFAAAIVIKTVVRPDYSWWFPATYFAMWLPLNWLYQWRKIAEQREWISSIERTRMEHGVFS